MRKFFYSRILFMLLITSCYRFTQKIIFISVLIIERLFMLLIMSHYRAYTKPKRYNMNKIMLSLINNLYIIIFPILWDKNCYSNSYRLSAILTRKFCGHKISHVLGTLSHSYGAVAQLGARDIRIVEAGSSNLLSSTFFYKSFKIFSSDKHKT